MAQTLTPVPFVADGGVDITPLLATPTAAVLQFNNSGREILFVSAGATLETVTVNIGELVLGVTVNSFPVVNLTNGHLVAFGPFHSVDDQTGTSIVQVTLSTFASIQVALLQSVGVY
jgi:hypothetical protein